MENEVLLSTVSPHKVVYIQNILRLPTHVLFIPDIDTSTFAGHSKRAACTSEAKSLRVTSKEVFKRCYWSRYSTFLKNAVKYNGMVVYDCFKLGVFVGMRQFCREYVHAHYQNLRTDFTQ